MVDFYNSELLDIVPDNFKTSEMQVFSHVLKKYMQKLQQYAKRCSMMAAIPELPEEILDLLAVELRSQYYDTSLPRKTKEEIIKNTLSWYAKSGTVSVLEEFFAAVFDGGEIKEWFQYGGEPYFFKALINISDSEISPDKNRIVKQQIEAYKNKRSWLDKITYLVKSQHEIDVNSNLSVTFRTQFYPRYNVPFLYFDGAWKWNGNYTLDGYKKGNRIDFYPASLQIISGIKQKVQPTSQLCIKNKVNTIVKNQAEMEIQSDIAAETKAVTNLTMQAEVKHELKQTGKLTIKKDLWFLDGTYLLDGTKLLDAEIIEQEL